MSTAAASLFVKLGLSDSEFDKGLKQTENKLNRLGSRLSTLGSRITTGVSLPFLAAGTAAVKMSADMETTTVAFTTLLGSAEKAQAQLTLLKDFAAKTPFQFTELTDASRRMMAMGFSAEQVIPTMRVLGNTVGALGVGTEGLNNIILALGQMQMKGKVSSEEMTRQLGQYVNAWQYLADYLDTDVATAMDQAKKGMISGATGVKAVLQGLANDTKFKDGMEKQMTTINGLWSNFIDNLKFGLTDLGDQVVKSTNLKEVLSSITQGIKDFTAWFASLDETTRNVIVKIALFTAALGPLLIILGKVTTGWSALVGVLRTLHASAIVSGIKSITFAFQAMAGGAVTAGEAVGFLATSFAPLLTGGAIAAGLYIIVDLFKNLAENARIAKLEIANISTMSDLTKKEAAIKKELAELQAQGTTGSTHGGWTAAGIGTISSEEQKRIEQLKNDLKEIVIQKEKLAKTAGTKTTKFDTESIKNLLASFSDATTPEVDKAKRKAEIESQARLEAMSDGMEKEMLILDENYQQQLEEAKQYGADTTDITANYMQDRANIMLEYWQKEQAEEEKQNEYLQKLWEENYPWAAGLQKSMEDWENWAQHVKDIATATAEGMQESFSDFFADAIKGEIDDLGDYFESFADSVISAWSDAMAKILTSKIMSSSFGTALSSFFGLDGYASGGSVTGGKTVLVGEKGPELFTPNSNGSIIPNNQLSGSSGGGNLTIKSINVINSTGTKATSKVTTQTDPDGYIINVVLNALNTNKGGLHDAVVG